MQSPVHLLIRLRAVHWALLVGIITTLASVVWLQGQTRIAQGERAGYDLLYSARPGQQRNPDIVLVGIDQSTLQRLPALRHTWPLPRRFVGTAINTLHRDGARAIGVDLLFVGPGLYGTADNLALAHAITNAGNVVLPNVIGSPSSNLAFSSSSTILSSGRQFTAHAAGVGFVNVTLDADNVIRSFSPSYPRPHSAPIPSFAVTMVAVAEHKRAAAIVRSLPPGTLDINYADQQGALPVDGPTFPTYSLADVDSDLIPPSAFRNKIVLITPDVLSSKDVHQTPLGPMYGGYVEANMINTILRRNPIHPAGNVANTILLVLVGLATTAVAALLGFRRATTPTIALLIGYIVVAIALLRVFRISVHVLAPEVTIILVYATVTLYGLGAYLWSSRRRSRVISILFVDMRGFTGIAERLQPLQLATALDIYLRELRRAARSSRGTIAKYMGDQMIVLWNAPHRQPDHASLAVNTALEMMSCMEIVNERLDRSGLPLVDCGIGVNTGIATFGRMTAYGGGYDVVGDAVNIAARLCATAGRDEILLGQATAVLLESAIQIQDLGELEVKGKAQPVRAYRAVSPPPEVRQTTRARVTRQLSTLFARD
jgi:adenylate cyclase